MTVPTEPHSSIRRPDCFFIGGEWVAPFKPARVEVIDSTTELPFVSVAEAGEKDVDRAVSAAYEAFHTGPWPRLSHVQRADFLRAMAAGLRERADDLRYTAPRESGVVFSLNHAMPDINATTYEWYADMAKTFSFEEERMATDGGFGILVREPVGVVGAIIPWNAPLLIATNKIAPALLAGCTVVLKLSPEAPTTGYVLAEIAEAIGLPPGVLNMITADREVSELLVRDPRVDKISFTGSTSAGRRIASICGERIARFTLELGGKSAAVILNDFEIEAAASALAAAECRLTGQVCSSLTRVVVPRHRHDEMVDALAMAFGQVRVGDPFDPRSQMGPLVSERQRDRVEDYIAKGKADGATLVTGGGRPHHLDRGYYVEPTLFADVDNSSAIGQEEIFGPVLSVIPANDEEDAIRLANDTIYGLNASVFTNDAQRARDVARCLRSGTVGQNGSRSDFRIAFGGFKQSGIGREGGVEGLYPYLETKTIVLDSRPS